MQYLNTLLRCWQATGLGLAVCAAVTYGAWAVVVKPAVNERTQLDDLRATLSVQQEASQNLDRQAIALRKQIASYDEIAKANQHRFSDATTVNQQISTVNDIALGREINVDDLTVADPTIESELKVYPIHLAGRANYRQVAQLLHDLDASSDSNVILQFNVMASPDVTLASSFHLDLAWYVPVD